MHSFRSGCSITLSLLGASDDQVASHVGWKSIQMARYYSQVPKVMALSLPTSLLAQRSDGQRERKYLSRWVIRGRVPRSQ